MTNSEKAQHKAIQRTIERIIKKKIKQANKSLTKYYKDNRDFKGGMVRSEIEERPYGDVSNLKQKSYNIVSLLNDKGRRLSKRIEESVDNLNWYIQCDLKLYLGGYAWDCIKFVQGKGYYAYCLDVSKLKKYVCLYSLWDNIGYSSYNCWRQYTKIFSDNTKKVFRKTFFDNNISNRDLVTALGETNHYNFNESTMTDVDLVGGNYLAKGIDPYINMLAHSRDGIILKRLNEKIETVVSKVKNQNFCDNGYVKSYMYGNIGGKDCYYIGGKFMIPLVIVAYDGKVVDGVGEPLIYYRTVKSLYSDDCHDRLKRNYSFDLEDIETCLGNDLLINVTGTSVMIGDNRAVYTDDFEIDTSSLRSVENTPLPNDSYDVILKKAEKLTNKFPKVVFYRKLYDYFVNHQRFYDTDYSTMVISEYRKKFKTDEV